MHAVMLLPASQYVGASAFTWPAALFVWGPGSWSDLHRHHCVQLVMALDGTLRFRQRPRQRWTTCGAVLVRADAWHEVNARGTDVLIAFVDAESELGAALAQRTAADVTPVPMATVAEWRTQLGDSASLTAARVEPWVTTTLLSESSTAVDRSPRQACAAGSSEPAGGSRGGVAGCGRRERRTVSITIPAPVHDVGRRSPPPVCPLAAPAMRGQRARARQVRRERGPRGRVFRCGSLHAHVSSHDRRHASPGPAAGVRRPRFPSESVKGARTRRF